MFKFDTSGVFEVDYKRLLESLTDSGLLGKESESPEKLSEDIEYIINLLLNFKLDIKLYKEKLYKNPYRPQSILDEYVADHKIDINSTDKEIEDFLSFYESIEPRFKKWEKSSKKTPEERNREVYHDEIKIHLRDRTDRINFFKDIIEKRGIFYVIDFLYKVLVEVEINIEELIPNISDKNIRNSYSILVKSHERVKEDIKILKETRNIKNCEHVLFDEQVHNIKEYSTEGIIGKNIVRLGTFCKYCSARHIVQEIDVSDIIPGSRCETEGHYLKHSKEFTLSFHCERCEDDDKVLEVGFSECENCDYFIAENGEEVDVDNHDMIYLCDDCSDRVNENNVKNSYYSDHTRISDYE